LEYKKFYGFDFKLTGQWTGKRFHDTANNIKVKPFFLMGFGVSKKFKNSYEVFLLLDNLLNKKYQIVKDYPTPALSVQVGMKMEF
jgi:outer membrane cobalamin receptor